MRTNMGGTDRTLRLILAAVAAVLIYARLLTGTAALVLGILAIVFAVTSVVGFCPLYVPLGISTRKKTKPASPPPPA
jgi:hypothetical protein